MNEEPKKPRALRNVTVTLDPALLKRVRIKAAEADLSVSQYIAKKLRDDLLMSEDYQRAMQSYLSRGPMFKSSGEPYPKREELYDRTRIR
jgi:hypothetical protein